MVNSDVASRKHQLQYTPAIHNQQTLFHLRSHAFNMWGTTLKTFMLIWFYPLVTVDCDAVQEVEG